MSQFYMLRVAGREYGPIEHDDLRTWAREGRLLPTNEVRVVENLNWFPAGALDRVFGETGSPAPAELPRQQPPPLPEIAPASMGSILESTWTDSLRGIGTFFVVMLPIGLSGVLASWGSEWIQADASGSFDRADLIGLAIILGSLLLYLAAWPLCEGAVALGVSDLVEGRPIRAQPLLARSWRHRRGLYSAALIAWGLYFLWILIPTAAFGFANQQFAGSAIGWAFTALLPFLLAVWMLKRIFIRNLFRAQASVFQGLGGREAIRHSHELVSEPATPWHLRPLWIALMLYLVWFVLLIFITVLTSVPITAMMLGSRWAELQQGGQIPSIETLRLSEIPFWPWKAAGYLVQALVQTALQAYPIVGCTLLYLSRRKPAEAASSTDQGPEIHGNDPGA